MQQSLERFEASDTVNIAELQELWTLTTASARFRDSFQARLLFSSEQREKYVSHYPEFNRSLVGLPTARRSRLLAALRPVVRVDAEVKTRAHLAEAWATLSVAVEDPEHALELFNY